eukprot:Platyproteum_vivax@DN14895_c0_g1_i1.p1
MEGLEKDTLPYIQEGKGCYTVIDKNSRKLLKKYEKDLAAWESKKGKKRGPEPQKPNITITVPLGTLVKSMLPVADLWIDAFNLWDRMNEAKKSSEEGLRVSKENEAKRLLEERLRVAKEEQEARKNRST